MEREGLIFLFCFLFIILKCNADSGYIITAPKSVLPGANETVCVSLVELEAAVEFLLVPPTQSNFPPILMSSSNRMQTGDFCLQLLIPQLSIQDIRRSNPVLRARISGYTDSGDEFSDTQDSRITFQRRVRETFIQTDKPIYKAGQEVKIRILTIEYPEMKPYTEENYSEVWVTTPNDIRMQQWRDQTSQQGLVDLKMPLSTEPLLGTWTIHATIAGTTTTQTFKIDEYVLPKFDVIITAPSYIYNRDEEVVVKVCGVYSYGQPVHGTFTVDFSTLVNARNVEKTDNTRSDGCQDFILDLSLLRVRDASTLVIDATLREEATGVSQSERQEVRITNRLYQFQIAGADGFKPGLPYRGKVYVASPDGQPVANKTVWVSVNEVTGECNFTSEGTCTTDQAGSCNFTFDTPLHQAQTELNIKVKARKEQEAFTSNKRITAWFSRSGSFVQVQPMKVKYEVDAQIPVTLEFTHTGNDIRFSYRVFSKGKMVHHGNVTWSPANDERGSPNSQDQIPVRLRERRFANRKKQPLSGRRPYNHLRSRIEPPMLERYDAKQRSNMTIRIQATHRMAPMSTIVVYYVTDDGEVVSAKEFFEISFGFQNQVSADFSSLAVNPGGHVTLNVHANPDSLCAISAVDKSILLLEDSKQLTRQMAFAPLSEFESRSESKDKHCPQNPLSPRREIPRHPPSRRRYFTKHFDALWAFKGSGTTVLSNFDLETRPCWTDVTIYYPIFTYDFGSPSRRRFDSRFRGVPGPIRPVSVDALDRTVDLAFESPSFQIENSSPVPILRSYFPETWLWYLTSVGPSGRSSMPFEVPHTITDWVTTGFCTSSEHGLGVLPPVSLRVFQSFFLSLTLPYSVIKEEVVPIKVAVFNYRNECFTIIVTIEESSSFSVTSRDLAEMVCVCGNQAESVTFEIIPRRLGKAHIKVSGSYVSPITPGAPICGNNIMMDDMVEVADAVERSLLVEAEGAEREETTSLLICPPSTADESYRKDITLELPFNVIRDSYFCKVQVTGDVLGPVLSNLDRLVRRPTGCGEQNMIGFTPNIFVLQYLNRTRQNLPELYEKARGHMVIGYQRELNYRLRDGSYSAFGERDRIGSTWLTAFVLKSFAQASEFISIDPVDLQVTKNWLLENANSDPSTNCFESSGRVIHKGMQGGHSSEITLTAYVTIALLESGETVAGNSVLFDAQFCLVNNINDLDDTYALAIVTYALAKAGSNFAEFTRNKLDAAALTGVGTRYWLKDPTSCDGQDTCRASPADVEITAYALLAYLEGAETDHQRLLDARPIVAWLNSQRNGQGGFVSTQDTVIGLQALARYSELLYGEDHNLFVDVTTSADPIQQQAFYVTSENNLVMQEFEIDVVPNQLSVFAQGTGCALLQTVLRYNLPEVRLTSPSFDIETNSSDLSYGKCGKVALKICVTYLGPEDATNMATVEIKMVSGYNVDLDELGKINFADIGLMRYDTPVPGQPFALYFNEFDQNQVCFKLILKQDIIVKNAKPAWIKVYDYYKEGVLTYKDYSLCSEN